MAKAMYAPATYAEADLLFRVVVTISCSDPERSVFDAPTNHPRVESMTSTLASPKTRASTVSQARVVNTLTHSLIGTQARVADFSDDLYCTWFTGRAGRFSDNARINSFTG
jgi:hypothetical protein